MNKTKRLLRVIPIIALLVAVLWIPATASAAPKTKYEQLSATGLVSYIDEGNVKQLPNGRWLIKDRNVSGTFTGGAFADMDFALTYSGLVESAFTQIGVFQGEMSIGEGYSTRIWGTTQVPLASTPDSMTYYDPTYVPLDTVAYYVGDLGAAKLIYMGICSAASEYCALPRLSFGGTWNFTGSTQGFGQFSGSFVFVPDVDAQGNPHVGLILPGLSNIDVTGVWRQ